MPELRKDPIVGRWVIISAERAKRPVDFEVIKDVPQEKTACPFCEGNEKNTPPEVFAIRDKNKKANTSGWDVRVVPSISPIFMIEGNLDRRGKGIYDVMNGVGAHEIVIETPNHIANIAELDESQIAKVLMTYIQRIKDLEGDKRFKYVLIFKNYGEASGGSPIKHSRSQLIAMPVNPKRVKEELVGSKKYFEYKERCVYCDIVRQEIDSNKRIIVEEDGFLSFAPFASRFPFETWIIPKEHSPDFTSLKEENRTDLARVLKITLLKLSRALNDPPYNYIFHTAPFRRQTKGEYWKTIDQDFHWHIEIMPRLTKVAGFEWGSGFYINPTPPEEAARYLKEVEI